MKFNKVLIGLMVVTPFALTSCNNAMSYDQALAWVKSHYKTADVGGERGAIISYDWDYHKTAGDDAKALAEKVTAEIDGYLKDELYSYEQPGEIITFHPDNKTGHEILVNYTVKVQHLDAKSFTEFKDIEGVIYKANGNNFTTTYTHELACLKAITDLKDPTVTIVRTYNGKGYCTDAGVKTGRKYISRGNFIDMKILLKFTYSDSESF